MTTAAVVVKKKPWWKSKTVWIGTIQIAAGLIAIPQIGAALGGSVAAKGVLDILLRLVTSAPLTSEGER